MDYRLIPVLLASLVVGISAAVPADADGAAERRSAEEVERTNSFGIFPYVTPVQMVKFHTPLHRLLEDTLGRQVALVSAPGFLAFVHRTQKQEYDYILTAPHLGRLAEVRDGYRPIARTLHEVQGVYLVRADSAIRTLQDLEGKTLTMVGREAIITQMVEHQLRGIGLVDGENLQINFTRTHNNAMYAPLRGESDASATGILLWRKIGQDDREQVRVIGETPIAPGFILMAADYVPDEEVERVRKAVFSFGATDAGKAYFSATGFGGFAEVLPGEMQSLDPYTTYFLDK